MTENTRTHVVITGAASGIGLATASHLAARGVALTLIDQAPMPPGFTGAQDLALQADVRSARALAEAFAAGTERFGPPTGAVLSAGVLGPVGPLHEADIEAVRTTMEINLYGVLYGMREALARMVEQRTGSIVAVASAAGTVGFPTAAPYTASKHAIVGLVKTCALDYAQAGIRVNAVAPGGVDTPLIRATTCATPEGRAFIEGLHPVKRLAQPEEIATGIAFLLSEQASFITGAVLPIDGGWTAQ